jgi:hypothetical protein
MRIALSISERVVLAVASDPFFGDDGRREPKPDSHGKRRDVMEPHAAMCLRSMEEERYADISYMASDDDEYDRHPPSSGQFPEPWHPEAPRAGKTSIARRCGTRDLRLRGRSVQSSEGSFAVARVSQAGTPAMKQSNSVAPVTLPNMSNQQSTKLRDESRRVSET